jgi:hypothetical protein
MLTILLGASKFPNAPKLAQGRAFYNSAADIKEYLWDAHGLALPWQNTLSLFDDSRSPSDQLVEVAKFLMRRTQELKNEGSRPEDLLIYYVGHGLFTRGDQAYCLAVRSTNEINEGATSIRAGDLAGVIKENSASLRRYLIFDCCFAASLHKEFQSSPLSAAHVQIVNEFPRRGTAVLCSSSSGEPSLAPPGLDHTMFTSALMQVLRKGHEGSGPRFSLSELGDLIVENLRNAFPDSWVRPEVHSPDQREGTIADIPLFPNPAYRGPILIPIDKQLKSALFDEVVPEKELTPQQSLQQGANTRMEMIDLTPFANFEFDWYKKPPSGLVHLEGVFYRILSGKRAVVHTANPDRPGLATTVSIPLQNGTNVRAVHILINGNWVGQTANLNIGEIRLVYSEGPAIGVPLIANQTIAETWSYNDEIFGTTIEDPPPGVQWREVDHEAQRRSPRETQGSDEATGFLHALSITADPTRTLIRLEIIGKSRLSGIIVTAITLELSPNHGCFISHSTEDQEFAERLYLDLRAKNVRCWFAPHDVESGKKLHEQIDQAIELHERLLLILSPHSINSEWVKTEIKKARNREITEKRRVLFPIRLTSFEALKKWEYPDPDTGKDIAQEIREYYIPDFTTWKKNQDLYQEEFKKLLKSLTRR